MGTKIYEHMKISVSVRFPKPGLFPAGHSYTFAEIFGTATTWEPPPWLPKAKNGHWSRVSADEDHGPQGTHFWPLLPSCCPLFSCWQPASLCWTIQEVSHVQGLPCSGLIPHLLMGRKQRSTGIDHVSLYDTRAWTHILTLGRFCLQTKWILLPRGWESTMQWCWQVLSQVHLCYNSSVLQPWNGASRPTLKHV